VNASQGQRFRKNLNALPGSRKSQRPTIPTVGKKSRNVEMTKILIPAVYQPAPESDLPDTERISATLVATRDRTKAAIPNNGYCVQSDNGRLKAGWI
jgi:hypothetical protein